MKHLLQLQKLWESIQVLRDFVDNDRVCDKCLKLFLCEIIEQLGQNGGKNGMGVEAEMVNACGRHGDFLSRHCRCTS